jgi:hypothetical protein
MEKLYALTPILFAKDPIKDAPIHALDSDIVIMENVNVELDIRELTVVKSMMEVPMDA